MILCAQNKQEGNKMLKQFAIATLLTLSSCTSFASASQGTISNFYQLNQVVGEFSNPSQTLLVMDDDDTLTRMPCNNSTECQYLGGPAWYSWQSSLPTNSPDRVAQTSGGLLTDSALIFSLSNETYTQASTPSTLVSLTNSGVHLLVETARGPSLANSTHRQFQALTVNDTSSITNLAQLINDNALKGPEGLPSFASPYQPCGNQSMRSVRYEQGVLYLAGQDKGEMLNCFLKHAQSNTIKNIVFIDDTQKNVESVYNAFKDNPNYHVIALHFTALDQFKAALTQGPQAKANQARATKRWHHIIATLQSQLPDANIAG